MSLRRLLPTLASQVGATLALAVALAHVVTVASFLWLVNGESFESDPLASAGRIAGLADAIDRGFVPVPGDGLQVRPASPGEEAGGRPSDVGRFLRGRIEALPGLAGRADEESVLLRAGGRAWVATMQRRPWYKGPFVLPWLSSLAALMAGGVLLLSYAVRRVTAPLSAVAEATRGFAGDAVGQPLPVTGPREVAEVAAACNGMRTRVASLVEERTRMLAALGHDLRTPLTRLRLRAETSADAVLREAVVREVERVDAMLTEAIAFALPGADGPRPDPIDLAGFAATLCDAYADLGHGVSYTGPSRMPALAPEASLDRILTNLVDNGLRHGARVEVSLRAEAGAAVLVVADDGPGIPVEARARVLEPFYTTDHARRRTGQGFGLGLSIVRDLARRMGGDVALGDGPHGRGLAVTVTLPVLLPGARAA